MPARTVDGKFYPHSWQRDGYYPRLEQAASRLLDDLMGEIPDTTSIEELIKAVEGARAEVIRIVREAVRELGKKGVH